jgi:hypothetical protein
MRAWRRESAPSGPLPRAPQLRFPSAASHSLVFSTRGTFYRNAGQSLFQSWFTRDEFLWRTLSSMADIEVRPPSRQAEQMIWDQEPSRCRGVVFFIPKMMGGIRALNPQYRLPRRASVSAGVGRSLPRLAASFSLFCHAGRWSKGHKLRTPPIPVGYAPPRS